MVVKNNTQTHYQPQHSNPLSTATNPSSNATLNNATLNHPLPNVTTKKQEETGVVCTELHV
jgi:hypothetical protein